MYGEVGNGGWKRTTGNVVWKRTRNGNRSKYCVDKRECGSVQTFASVMNAMLTIVLLTQSILCPSPSLLITNRGSQPRERDVRSSSSCLASRSTVSNCCAHTVLPRRTARDQSSYLFTPRTTSPALICLWRKGCVKGTITNISSCGSGWMDGWMVNQEHGSSMNEIGHKSATACLKCTRKRVKMKRRHGADKLMYAHSR